MDNSGKIVQGSLFGESVVTQLPPIRLERRWLDVKQSKFLWRHCSESLSWVQCSSRGVALPRLNAAYTSVIGGQLTYSGVAITPSGMDKVLQRITARVNDYLGLGFNTILLNWYTEPSHHIGWHRDNVLECGLDSPVASLSLGTSRVFQMRQGKAGQIFSHTLNNGDLLLMPSECQRKWVHRVPAVALSTGEPQTDGRISLTFRQIKTIFHG